MLRPYFNLIFCSSRWRPMLAVVLAFFVSAATAWGQAAWEFEPYRVQIWLALPDDPTWNGAQLEQISTVLTGRAETTFGPVWECGVQLAPETLAGHLRDGLQHLTVEQVREAVPEKFAADKIYLVSVHDDRGLLKLQVRELDYRARQLGVLLERETPQRDALPWQIWDAVAQAFTPIVRIERIDGTKIAARIRAGGLITTPDSSAWIKAGSVLRPVTRRNDRAGEPAKGGINLVPWTMIEVLEQTGSILACKLNSGYKTPIPVKANSRTERLAMLVRPQFPATVLHLRSRDVSATPLAGYEVWRKLTSTDGELIGSTDWRGDLELPRAETGALQTLLVRSGGQLLARLPIVPGQQPRMEASVADDDGRLQAEGFVTAFRSKLMDLEARRQIAAARIRAKIADNKLDEAQAILEEMRSFESRADLVRLIDQQKVKSSEVATQKRIDKMLADAKVLLSKFLDPELPNVLQRELLAAKKSPPKPAPAKGATTPTNQPTPPATPPANSTPMPMPMPPGK